MAQLLISPLTGGWGLVLTIPLMVIINDISARVILMKRGLNTVTINL